MFQRYRNLWPKKTGLILQFLNYDCSLCSFNSDSRKPEQPEPATVADRSAAVIWGRWHGRPPPAIVTTTAAASRPTLEVSNNQ